PGKKLAITGKGRCNVTNQCENSEVIASVPTNGRFLYSALSVFSPQDIMEFFERLGVPLKVERGNRDFPQSAKASDIVEALVYFIHRNGVELVTGEAVSKILLPDGKVNGVEPKEGNCYHRSKVLIACGASSYPGTGSNGDGFRLAQKAGHTISP